jgi:hypothetical protein
MSTWTSDRPTVKGWYAIMYSWDVHEGSFPGAKYWTGMNWEGNLPVVLQSSRPFESETKASDWAQKHDVEK